MQIRRAAPADLAAVGEVTVAAYSPFLLGPEDPYAARLRDAAARAEQAELEFRMLSVAPGAQGQGVGAALVEHVLDHYRRADARAVVLSSLVEMAAAHRLYARHGFTRLPERDWSPVPDVHLIAFGTTLGGTP